MEIHACIFCVYTHKNTEKKKNEKEIFKKIRVAKDCLTKSIPL